MSVFMNTLKFDDADKVINYEDSRFRAFQYFRTTIDSIYPFTNVTPAFELSEIEEPDCR
jgi:hypothetical protein